MDKKKSNYGCVYTWIYIPLIAIILTIPELFLVYWTIEDLPIIYGRNVTLFCNTSAVGSQKTTWMKQSNVIFHHGLSFQPDKYSGKEESDGSSLIIMNATISDFNTSYTCLSDVYSYESVLEINNSNFICK